MHKYIITVHAYLLDLLNGKLLWQYESISKYYNYHCQLYNFIYQLFKLINININLYQYSKIKSKIYGIISLLDNGL